MFTIKDGGILQCLNASTGKASKPLRLEANVAGIDEATFQKIAAAAKQGCPLSKALASVPEITLTAVLRK